MAKFNNKLAKFIQVGMGKWMLTNEEWNIMPPGSDAAITKGCTCPILDNGYGRGMVFDGIRQWWIAEDCPLHGGQRFYSEVQDADGE